MSLSLESAAFTTNTLIAREFTCQGADLSPPLAWQDLASNTQSYALIVEDPDAPGGTWDHWILINIPANVRQLAEGGGAPAGSISLQNSWGLGGYRGPCPPSGTHRYVFKLYALDTLLSLGESANKDELLQAISGHIIASSELVGLYRKN